MPVAVEGDPKGLLGLARRAGRLAAGDHAVRFALQRGRAALVLVAEDAGAACRRRFAHLTAREAVPMVVWGRKADLGAAVGRSQCAVLAVTDKGLAAALRDRLSAGAGGTGAESGGEPFVTKHPHL
ncbi:MAG TPA: ribosomal L7Ae/L30e/S12e/Gadd45 family protein [Thermaerobacter sp.]